MSRLALLLGALAPSAAYGATLLASHFVDAKIYTLNLSGSSLSITGNIGGCGTTPGWLEYYSDDKTLYCFDESWGGSGFITKYGVAADGKLTQQAQQRTPGNTVHGVLYGGSDGKGYVATTEFTPSTMTTYKLPLGGQALSTFKFPKQADGPDPRQKKGPNPHQVLLDPSGKFIIVPDLGSDLIHVFSIESSTGKLNRCGSSKTGAGDGPRHGAWYNSTAGLRLYIVNELGSSVSTWSATYSGGCIALSKLQSISALKAGTRAADPIKAAEIRVVGDFVYASNRADKAFGNNQDSIATYTINPASGQITLLEQANSYSFYPRTFSFNKAGTLAAIGGQTSSTVAVVERDPATGKLGKLVAKLQIGKVGQAGQEDGLSAVVWVE